MRRRHQDKVMCHLTADRGRQLSESVGELRLVVREHWPGRQQREMFQFSSQTASRFFFVVEEARGKELGQTGIRQRLGGSSGQTAGL